MKDYTAEMPKIRLNKQLHGVDKYEFFQGHKPRGFGFWMFEFTYIGRTVERRGFSDIFAVAKKRAFEYAKESGAILVELVS